MDSKLQVEYRKPNSQDIKGIAFLHYTIINSSLVKHVPSICKFSDLTLSIDDVEKNIEDMVKDQNRDIIVASLEDKIVGFLSLWTESYSDDLIAAPFTTIEYIEVHPDYRSLGIGQSFMQEAERIARLKNHQYLELLVWETNKNAIKLYERNNFTPIVIRMIKKL